jgi:hypothetical protein
VLLLALFVSVTEAFGTTAPVASETTPVMLPVLPWDCAKTCTEASRVENIATARKLIESFFIYL